ncbi:MAG: helix-turn-helix domain-containing protein, partial [Chitinivibrionales bacterium]|nr:helix-turn-helix domain-containing protein [Chitinivibrionales bacterium]
VRGVRTPPHIHDGLEFGTVCAGAGMLVLDGTMYALRKGDVYFFDALVPHAHRVARGRQMDNLSVQLTAEAVMNIPTLSDRSVLMAPFAAPRYGQAPVLQEQHRTAEMILDAYDALQRRTPASEIAAWTSTLSALTELAGVIAAAASPVESQRQHHDVMTRALSLLHGNYHRQLTVADIAEHCNMSESRFAHVFVEASHTTPMQYLTRLRVWAAVRHIKSSDDTISAIAMRCGFASMNSFYRAFRKTTGTTPAAMRRKEP